MFGAILGGLAAMGANLAGQALGNLAGGGSAQQKAFQEAMDTIKAGTKLKVGIYKQAGQQATQGAAFEARIDRTAGDIAVLTSNWNIASEQAATEKASDALGQELRTSISSNIATAGSMGNLGSKSTMAVNNDLIAAAERNDRQTRNDSTMKQSMIRYEGLLTQMQYENQARGAEYQGALTAQSYKNQELAAQYEGDNEIYNMMMDNPMPGGGLDVAGAGIQGLGGLGAALAL
jgi:hypothetical protein